MKMNDMYPDVIDTKDESDFEAGKIEKRQEQGKSLPSSGIQLS